MLGASSNTYIPTVTYQQSHTNSHRCTGSSHSHNISGSHSHCIQLHLGTSDSECVLTWTASALWSWASCHRNWRSIVREDVLSWWTVNPICYGHWGLEGKKMGGGGGGGGGALVVGSNIIIVQCICKLVMILIHDMLITCSSWITTLGWLWAKCEQSICIPLRSQSAIVLLFYEILNCYSGCYSVAYDYISLSCN